MIEKNVAKTLSYQGNTLHVYTTLLYIYILLKICGIVENRVRNIGTMILKRIFSRLRVPCIQKKKKEFAYFFLSLSIFLSFSLILSIDRGKENRTK